MAEILIKHWCLYEITLRDVEKNPGHTPMHVDSIKTIGAPYSQGNELLFGQNAGQQCVTMSMFFDFNTRPGKGFVLVMISST